jgi:hypothetical protein
MRQPIPLMARARAPATQVRLREARAAGTRGVGYIRLAPTGVAVKASARATEPSPPLEDLITGYFLVAAQVLAQFEKK